MPINQNHLFEELNGIKCAIVEKYAAKERVDFLKSILEYNHYTVIAVPGTPPKVTVAKSAPAASADENTTALFTSIQEIFTIGVTDVMFNPINAIFGRLLKEPGGNVVTLAYWQQKEKEPHDEIPYFDK